MQDVLTIEKAPDVKIDGENVNLGPAFKDEVFPDGIPKEKFEEAVRYIFTREKDKRV